MKNNAVKNLERFNLCKIKKDAVKKLKGGNDTATPPEIIIEDEVDS